MAEEPKGQEHQECGSCYFWRRSSENRQYGDCRANPPIASLESMHYAIWPLTVDSGLVRALEELGYES